MTEINAEALLKAKGIIGKPLEVIRMGHPTLKQKAKAVTDIKDAKISQAIANIFATINKIGKENVAGLAAPQVNIPLQILIFQVPNEIESGIDFSIPYSVVINPIITPIGEEKETGFEGCISVPGLVGLVPRYKQVRYSYQTITGENVTVEATGHHARVIQHESDHLAGTLYVERMENMQQLYFDEEFYEFVVNKRKQAVS